MFYRLGSSLRDKLIIKKKWRKTNKAEKNWKRNKKKKKIVKIIKPKRA